MPEDRKRSSIERMQPGPAGVGARHKGSPPDSQGAGYLDVCMKSRPEGSKNRARDPRIDELREHGVSWRWIAIAEAIGYDNFVIMWRMATALFADSDRERPSMVRILMPHVRKLDRIQRDSMISTLKDHCDPDEIRDELERTMSIMLSRRQVCRIIKRLDE